MGFRVLVSSIPWRQTLVRSRRTRSCNWGSDFWVNGSELKCLGFITCSLELGFKVIGLRLQGTKHWHKKARLQYSLLTLSSYVVGNTVMDGQQMHTPKKNAAKKNGYGHTHIYIYNGHTWTIVDMCGYSGICWVYGFRNGHHFHAIPHEKDYIIVYWGLYLTGVSSVQKW